MQTQPSICRSYFTDIANNVSLNAKQHAYYQWITDNAIDCHVTSIQHLLTFAPNFVAKLLKADFKKHECYNNAYKVCDIAASCNEPLIDVQYVEGQIEVAGLLGVDHAWNKVNILKNESIYIDVTSELVVLNKDNLTTINYLAFKSFNFKELMSFLIKSRMHGTAFIDWFKEQVTLGKIAI